MHSSLSSHRAFLMTLQISSSLVRIYLVNRVLQTQLLMQDHFQIRIHSLQFNNPSSPLCNNLYSYPANNLINSQTHSKMTLCNNQQPKMCSQKPMYLMDRTLTQASGNLNNHRCPQVTMASTQTLMQTIHHLSTTHKDYLPIWAPPVDTNKVGMPTIDSFHLYPITICRIVIT